MISELDRLKRKPKGEINKQKWIINKIKQQFDK